VPENVAKNDVGEGDRDEDRDHERGPTRDQLKVTLSDLNKSMEADDGSIDYLPHVPRGDITVLNAKKFTYAAFFNRMKKVIRFHWDPLPALQAIGNPTSKISASFWIVLNGDGSLAGIDVLDSSGYPLWDAAAIKAVRKAAPFYNVPQALLDEEGKFGSRWTFVTY
jgi:TonB family protein